MPQTPWMTSLILTIFAVKTLEQAIISDRCFKNTRFQELIDLNTGKHLVPKT